MASMLWAPSGCSVAPERMQALLMETTIRGSQHRVSISPGWITSVSRILMDLAQHRFRNSICKVYPSKSSLEKISTKSLRGRIQILAFIFAGASGRGSCLEEHTTMEADGRRFTPILKRNELIFAM